MDKDRGIYDKDEIRYNTFNSAFAELKLKLPNSIDRVIS